MDIRGYGSSRFIRHGEHWVRIADIQAVSDVDGGRVSISTRDGSLFISDGDALDIIELITKVPGDR